MVSIEHDPDYNDFVAHLQGYFLTALPGLFMATEFMAVIDMLSAHSPDEESINERDVPAWSSDPEIQEDLLEVKFRSTGEGDGSLGICAIASSIERIKHLGRLTNGDRRSLNRNHTVLRLWLQ
ncbi:Lipoxygenase, C-terminal [Dillenia turbinata]|uniref:Lipoxygenase, C-terminal n=1 Tax=Dillenia turbinata TaxID=194707 RepID=A0AAN8VRJ6_9MAGN